MSSGKQSGGNPSSGSLVFDVKAGDWAKEVMESDLPVAVDFWHDNCVWCRRLDPIYETLAREFEGRMRFGKLHVFREGEIAQRFSILGTPTVKFFCKGREVHEIVGFRPEGAFREEVERVLENYENCIESSTSLNR